MSLDARAAKATRSLQASVATVAPVGIPSVARRQRASMFTSFAFAAVFLLAFVGIASAMPSFFDPDRVANGSDIPDPELPAVIDPDDKESEGELVELDKPSDEPPIRQLNSSSDLPEPWTKFSGLTEPGTTVSAESEWGTASLVVDDTGEFALKLSFESLPTPGAPFPIVVTVGADQYAFEFTSFWDPNAVTATANQVYGSSHDASPYERFFGTAPPGSEITVGSDYGTAAVTADDTGLWSAKVWFEGAPTEEAFVIVVTVDGESFTFSFVSHFAATSFAQSVSQLNTTSDSSTPFVQFTGTGPAGSAVAASSPYGSTSVTVGSDGTFALKLWFSSLPPAGQPFTVDVAFDGVNFGSYGFTSLYAGSTTTTTSGGGGGASAVVTQHNTESWDPDPWIKFLVEGPTGTQVDIISPYGSMSTTTSSSSEYVKLWFSSLPTPGVQFSVTVKIDGAVHGTYPFTSHYDPAGVPITATQFNTESWDANPWVKFNVTGPVGTVVDVISPYGSMSQTLSSGNEYVKLWFSSLPPAGVQFSVTVNIDGSAWGTYPFTSHYVPAIPKTANATYQTCAEDPPWDIYYGTAPAGTAITISSPYGGGSTTADGAGNWSSQVFFSGAPLNETFTVTVQVGGEQFNFSMVHTG